MNSALSDSARRAARREASEGGLVVRLDFEEFRHVQHVEDAENRRGHPQKDHAASLAAHLLHQGEKDADPRGTDEGDSAQVDKEAMIIDERSNAGGQAAKRVINLMKRTARVISILFHPVKNLNLKR